MITFISNFLIFIVLSGMVAHFTADFVISKIKFSTSIKSDRDMYLDNIREYTGAQVKPDRVYTEDTGPM